ncbi:MAG: sulfatase-like hydrolase/transferase [Verrucomicrobiales bacterium]|nr:sulfatase-like hydrolase/transferase [Verrucomicrobiales bacterium]
MTRFLAAFTAAVLLFCASSARSEEKTPNIVYIMSDELAYFELSHMGNPYLKTPRIDQMAKDGIRFTNALAASPVCGPLRGCLMTGKHAGHASVRANDGGTPLRAEEETIASVLKQKNYATGGFGKWGAGGRESTGVPEDHGFDVFYGYYDQVHAHSFYPPYLIRNSEEVVLEGNEGGRSGETYSHYSIIEEGLNFIRENKDKPFFAYFPVTPPHGMYDIPADDPAWQQYKDEAWMKDPSISQEAKNYAAMVTMIDNNLGSILDLLEELKLEENTIVFFTGDNGGEDRFKTHSKPRGLFGPNVNPETGVGFRGGKRYLYEGGLKIPFLVQWPGKIEAGRVSDHVFAQYDIMATIADLTGTEVPEDTDGISILPEILGDSENQEKHEMFYWEYGNQIAVRYGNWKAIQPKKEAPWELYDLEKDISESTSVADENPDVLDKMKEFAAASHTPPEPGTYSNPDRTLHEKDREAKWGSTRKDDPKSRTTYKIKAKDLLPANEMKIVRFSSESFQNDRRAEYAIDGKIHTLWHTQFTTDKAEPPHELVIDLGAGRNVTAIHYLARQDNGWNGVFADTEFYLSYTADSFPDKPVATISFEKVKKAQSVEIPATKGRYLLVKNLSSVDGGAFGSAAEIQVSVAKEAEKKEEENTAPVDLLDPKLWTGSESWETAAEISGNPASKEWNSVFAGEGVLYSKGKVSNLVSKMVHGDCRLIAEFMVPKGSNSGIYFQDRYEIQILDSYGKADTELKYGDNGGIYQRWDDKAEKGKQGYEGTAPSSNQSKAPGEWQKFDITFRAPRFDDSGEKVENASFVSVIHNGVEIHKDVELTGPTRGGQAGPEVEQAPFKIQGDHGPVAFRRLEFYSPAADAAARAAQKEQSEALSKIITNIAAATELENGKRVQLRSMTLAAYRNNDFRPLWGNSAEPVKIYGALEQLLNYHGFSNPKLSFDLYPESVVNVGPISQNDLLVTLGLAETSLRLKQGPETVSEWPNWTYGDTPIPVSTSDHYNKITERFGQVASVAALPMEVADEFVPKNWIYHRLLNQIHLDVEIPDPPQIEIEGLIKVGNDFPEAMELASFLHREGHLSEAEVDVIDNVYTKELSDGLKAYQQKKGLLADGIFGPKTAQQISKKPKDPKETLIINLHRARRFPDSPGDRYLLANLPSAELYGIEKGGESLRMRVVFGKDVAGQHTPIFRDKMERIVFRPYWNVPHSIATTESPYSDLEYLSNRGFKIISSNSGAALPLSIDSLSRVRARTAYVRQDGGDSNALGLVKFLFPNKHAVYMHDTPQKHYFKNSYRAQSHGCVRLQDPEAMANWILKPDETWTASKINYAIYQGERNEVNLKEPIPVYLVYFTAFPDPRKSEGVDFHRDYYDYDLPGAVVDAPAPPREVIPLTSADDNKKGFFGKIFRNNNSNNNRKSNQKSSGSNRSGGGGLIDIFRGKQN